MGRLIRFLVKGVGQRFLNNNKIKFIEIKVVLDILDSLDENKNKMDSDY